MVNSYKVRDGWQDQRPCSVYDSKLRSCDLVKLRVSDIAHGNHILKRAMVMQQKTRTALTYWIEQANLSGSDFLFKGQTNSKGHISPLGQ